MPGAPDDLPLIPFADAAAFDAWLAANGQRERGIWLKFAKKASGITSITYSESVDVALCWGWIDGQKRGFDDTWYLLRFTPRGPRSVWSVINRDKVIRLEAEGKMRDQGRAAVANAKSNGRWDAAYEGQRNATVPDDLQAALAASPRAQEFFETLTGASRYAVIYRVGEALRPETRARRIARFIEMLENGEAPHLI